MGWWEVVEGVIRSKMWADIEEQGGVRNEEWRKQWGQGVGEGEGG